MEFIHPALLIAILVLAFYALWMGVMRAMFLHCGKCKGKFAWRRHARLGSWVLLLWAVGVASGFVGAHFVWGDTFVMEDHALRALFMLPGIMVAYVTGKALDLPAKNSPAWQTVAMLPFALAGKLSGGRVDQAKARRYGLPAFHGLNNGALVLLASLQTYSGIELLQYI